MATPKEFTSKEFKVRIDVKLPPEVQKRIERAIQKAVLTELAEVDVASGYSVNLHGPDARTGADDDAFGPPGKRIATDGIWIKDEPPAIP